MNRTLHSYADTAMTHYGWAGRRYRLWNNSLVIWTLTILLGLALLLAGGLTATIIF